MESDRQFREQGITLEVNHEMSLSLLIYPCPAPLFVFPHHQPRLVTDNRFDSFLFLSFVHHSLL